MSKIGSRSSIRTLHVDDDPQFGDLVQTYLQKIDDRFEVVTETDPQSGLERVENEQIDCVVSDYQMPQQNGLELLTDVRERYPNLPFILFTGEGSEEIASEAINAGVTDYLQKGGPESYELLANDIQNEVGRRRSEHQAKIAKDRLVRLYEQTDGFYSLDEDWTITYWNQQMANRTGKTPEEVTGEVFWDVFAEAVDTEIREKYRVAKESQEVVRFETKYEPDDYWVEIQVYPVDSGYFVHSREITEEKERQREIQYRNEILESFASTVSHDLRNPLNVAEGRLQLAQETGDFEHLEEVAKAHNRMQNLIDELLHVARGDELDLSQVSLTQIAEQSWRTVSSDEVQLTTEDDITFRAYESQLQRLFENLFWNALDHGDATAIRVGRIGEGFYVEDDGTGIPPSNREDVFTSGFSTDDLSPGYGLSIVDGIVEIHDWEVTVESGDMGGARFEITGLEEE